MFFAVVVHGEIRWDDDDSPLKRTYIVEATDYGLQRMNELVNVQEPRLYQIGMWLDKDNPARYVAAFNGQSDVARRLAKFGYASLQATSKLVQHLYSGVESRAAVEGLKFPTISLLHTALHNQCPLRSDQLAVCPDSSGRYRTADGRCNNPAHPWWGASMMPLHRFLPSHYRDGLERIRVSVSGGPLPSARLVSSVIHSDRDSDLTSITHMVMQWGQFLDHDLTSSAQSRGFNGSVPKCCTDGGRDFQPPDLTHPDCMAITVPPDDWFYSHYGICCLEFVRSSPTSRVGCSLGPRDQINQVTSFIDASAVYGSSEKEEDDLRMFRNGLLKYSRVQYRLPLLPAATYKADLCRGQSGHLRCFHAGDKRVNEQPGLIALHTIFMRAHNKIATELSHINPHWRDEKLYQETRRIIGAIMQHITFKEFLPIVLGQDVMKLFDLELMKKGYFTGYDIKTNPTAANAFGTAAFRFGHSLVQHSLMRCDRSHHRLFPNVSLHEELTNPANLYNIGSVDRLLLGLCQQPAQKRDEFITEELTNHLFQTPSYGYGMDLAALNIQRGRDHGLAPYNAWREPCGLQPLTDWPNLLQVMSAETQRKLKRIYRDVDDIDLFPGAMAERPVSGGLVGSTFACILAQQFSNLRKGDRFWYENGGFESSFTLAQLQQIRRVTLARMLCDNLDGIDTLQPFVFLTVDNDRNYRVPCDSEYILHLDLKPWTEHRKQEQYHHEKPTDHQHLSSHHTPSYPSYQKPTPSYHHTTTPSYEEHQPSYLIDIELQPPPKPHEENKPTYLIDTNFQGKPTKPQNLYTSSIHPKPDEHKPTYLIDESFQQTERPTSKRPYSGYKPSNSAHLAMEHKQPDYNNHNQGHDHGAELPSKLETRPPGDYHHHHEEEYSQSETEPTGGHNHLSIFEHHGGYNPHKPHKEYPSNHYEPVHHKPHYEQQTTDKPHSEYPHHKPHDEYPSYSKPHYEHTTHSKPYDKYPSYSKPHYEHTTQSTPHYEFPNSKPHYGHTSKPYNEHTSHYKPQYVYTFNIPHTTISSKPHYEHTSFTKPSDNKDIPSTLDYNKYKPHPSKPSSHQDGSYSVVTRPPYKEQHYSGTYSSAGRPSYEKPSSGYHHTSYSYIEVFNEPTYYYLEDSKVVGNAHRSPEKATLDPGLLDFKSSMMQTNSSSMEQEPRTSLGDSDIVPPDDVNSYAGLTTFTGDTTSENNETVNFVTIKGNIVSINATPDEKRKIMVFSSRINITEDANVNNNVPNTSILHSEKQVNTMENINVIVTENITKSDNTTTIMNARNTTELNNTEFGNTMDNITNSSKINITNLENNNNFIITAIAKQNKTDSTKTTNNSTNSSIGIEHSITENNIHLDNININLGTQPNNTRNNNTANENVESITEQTKTAYDSTIFYINKIDTNVTNVNNIINTNTDIQMNTGEQTTTLTKITQQDMNINTNTETSQETVLKTDMTIHELTPNTTYAESYTAYAIITENENEWIFTKEEDDGSFIIPEMPSIASDPMALKELPRPMTFENEETGRGLV